jgi:hypothetical protein
MRRNYNCANPSSDTFVFDFVAHDLEKCAAVFRKIMRKQ